MTHAQGLKLWGFRGFSFGIHRWDAGAMDTSSAGTAAQLAPLVSLRLQYAPALLLMI